MSAKNKVEENLEEWKIKPKKLNPNPKIQNPPNGTMKGPDPLQDKPVKIQKNVRMKKPKLSL